MDYSCPSCGCSLKSAPPRFVPQRGARKFLALGTGLFCPACNQRVAINWHPFEKRVRNADASLILLFALISYFVHEFRILYAGMLISGLGEIALSLWTRKRLQSWKRYALAVR